MKTWKLISMLLLAFMAGACDDDPVGEEGNGGGAGSVSGSGASDRVSVSWGTESKTVLKNAGQVLVPVKLSEPAGKAVKVTVAAQQSDEAGIAREGIDFDLPEKVVTFPAGDTLSFLTVDLLDNGKVEADRTVVLNITGVYDGQVGAAKTCSLYIVNNAFVEFQYKNRETTEAAGSYKIPVLVTGELLETTTFTVRVKEGGTALEGTHFNIKETSFTLAPGATSAEVEIELIDDDVANEDRWFDLEIIDVAGSNAAVGKSAPLCRVKIVSEEVFKSVSFDASAYTVQEGQDLYIPVILDKAPTSGETDVVVTFSVKSSSTAVEGEDFTVVEKQIRFVPGQKEDELVIKTTDNVLINADKIIELSIKAAAGANIGEANGCTVTIENNDFPVFEQNAYTLEEDFGDLLLPVTLPAAYTTDLRLKLAVVDLGNAVKGKHYQLAADEVIVPAGQTQANVALKIGYNREWTETPKFKVVIAEANDVVLEKDVCEATFTLEQCHYRKLLGDWDFKIGSYDGNGKKYTDLVRNMTFEEKVWNQSFTVKTEWLIGWNTLSFVVDYDKETKNASWRNDVPLYRGVNFNGTVIDCYLRTAVQEDKYWSTFQYPMPLVWDEANNRFIWNVSEKFGVQSDCRITNTTTGASITWFIFKDLSMTKK